MSAGIRDYSFTVHERKYAFSLTYDQNSKVDQDILFMFSKVGCPEPEVIHAMERIISPGDTVIDGGANVGFFTLVMSQLVGPKGKVIAIEPGQNNHWKLEANLRVNKVNNVEVVRRPLWSKEEVVRLNMCLDGGLNSLSKGDHHRGWEDLPAVTLSSFPVPRLVKLDIEGAEAAVLMGAKEWAPYVICEMNDPALRELGSSREGLRDIAEDGVRRTFILRGDGLLPVCVPRNTKIVCDARNLNVMFSTLDAVGEAWPEAPIGKAGHTLLAG